MDYITAVYRHEKGLVLLVDIAGLFGFEDQAAATRATATQKTA
jgi:hypothetical protein